MNFIILLKKVFISKDDFMILKILVVSLVFIFIRFLIIKILSKKLINKSENKSK